MDGPAVCGWCLAVAIISSLSPLVLVYIYHCAFYCPPFVMATKEKKFLKKTALPKALRKV